MIYIVTPVYNRKEFTRNYLQALSKQTVKDFKVVIVDDGSKDGTADMIEQEFPKVILLKGKGDLWWAEATNIGVKYAMEEGADYIMTLNDDTVPQEDYMEKMIYWMQKKPDVLIGALAIDNESGEIIYGGYCFQWNKHRYESILENLSSKDQVGLHEVNTFPGRGLLIPVKVFEDIGEYDSNNFPQTYADIDFSARAVRHGYKIYCNYDSKIKIYPEESEGVTLRQRKSWKNYYQHLFGKKGAGNLKLFAIYTIKNSPKRYMLFNLVIGIGRRLLGYPVEWISGVLYAGK